MALLINANLKVASTRPAATTKGVPVSGAVATVQATPVATTAIKTQLSQPAAPTATTVAKTGAPGGVRFFQATMQSDEGETTPCAEQHPADVAADNALQIPSPASQVGAIGWNAYERTQLVTPAAPSSSSVTGTGGAGGARFFQVTLVTGQGETLPCAEQHPANITADHVLQIASPAAQAGATGWYPYVGATTGSEQNQSATPIAIGTAWTEPVSGLITGAVVPVANTAYVGLAKKQNATPIPIGTAFAENVSGIVAGVAPPGSNGANVHWQIECPNCGEISTFQVGGQTAWPIFSECPECGEIITTTV